jgi:hypothetical protein
MKRARHPPFSPDLALSDFYLCGKLKTALMGKNSVTSAGISMVS